MRDTITKILKRNRSATSNRLLPDYYHSFTRIGTLVFVLTMTACAYFNTFYNAQKYYNEGIADAGALLFDPEQTLSKESLEIFGKAAEKSQLVISKYPESKLVYSAYLILSKSHFFRGEYGLSERYLNELISIDTARSYSDEASVWLAKVHAMMGRENEISADLAYINDLDDLPRDLRGEIYLLEANIAMTQGNTESAEEAFELAAKIVTDPNVASAVYQHLHNLAYADANYSAALKYIDEIIRIATDDTEKFEGQLLRIKLLREMGESKRSEREILNILGKPEAVDIKPGLLLEMGRLRQATGDLKNAHSQYMQIIEEYQDQPQASEAAYLAGEIALMDYGDLKSALDNYKKVTNKSPSYPLATARIQLTESLERSLKTIASNRAILNLSQRDSTLYGFTGIVINLAKPDAGGNIDTVQIAEELAISMQRLAEIFLFDLGRQESGMEILAEITSEFGQTSVAAHAGFVLHNLTSDIPEQAEFWRSFLVGMYPSSRYARLLNGDDGGDFRSDLEVRMDRAARIVELDPRASISRFWQIRQSYGTEQSLIAIAYLYDEYLSELDSSIIGYEDYLSYYPDGKYKVHAESRLQFLRELKASGSVGGAAKKD